MPGSEEGGKRGSSGSRGGTDEKMGELERQPGDSAHGSAVWIAVLGAVIQEVELLFRILENSRTLSFRGESIRLGDFRGLRLLIGTTGLGKVNAAVTTAALLERFEIARVWNTGCSGAYPQGHLEVGDVLITDRALAGDEGILSHNGILSAVHIGIPVIEWHGEKFYDCFPLDRQPGWQAMKETAPPGLYPAAGDDPGNSFRLEYGPSLTVGMVSGDAETARERYTRYGALAENMEGSAVAQACFRFGIPFLECRGMSNTAGDRDKRNWQLQKAIRNSHAILLRFLGASL